MATSVTARNVAWADGVVVSGAEMRSAILGGIWSSEGIVRGLAVVQIPTPAMKVRVPAGLCMVADGQNGYVPIELAAQTDLDIGASSPTLPRIDSVIAEFVDNGGSSLYRIRVVAGTANASPVQPTLPYADQPTGKTLRLYNVAVAALATTIVDANISKQTFTTQLSSLGRLLYVTTDGGRPSTSTPSESIWRADKQCREVWTGSQWVEDYIGTVGPAWKSYTPVWSGSTTNPVIGNGTISGAYMKIGRTVHYRIQVLMGSTTTYGSGAYGLTLPFTPATDHASAAVYVDTSASLRYSGTAWITNASGLFRLLPPSDAGSVGMSGTSLFTFANTDQIIVSGTYEATS